MRSSFPQLRGHCLANYFTDPVFNIRELAQAARGGSGHGPCDCGPASFGTSLSWNDLPWLRSLTKLPLVLKGICHPDDVRRAIDGGVDGIYCSTHGGRQANGGVPAASTPPGVVEAPAGNVPVLFDLGAGPYGPTSSRPSPWGPRPSALAGPTPGAWRSATRRHRPCPAQPPGRGRLAHGRRRLSGARRPDPGYLAPHLFPRLTRARPAGPGAYWPRRLPTLSDPSPDAATICSSSRT